MLETPSADEVSTIHGNIRSELAIIAKRDQHLDDFAGAVLGVS